ncbi:MAG: DUF4136 domain-containing protein [Novosphingobium sp.]
MTRLTLATSALAALALAGCVAPTGPVEVTRFHAAAAPLARGTISVEPAPGQVPSSLEWQAYQGAVARELVRLGYTETPAGQGAQVALVSLVRDRFRPERNRSPVSVGVGGSTGSYGSGVGLGIGIDLSGRPAEQVETRLSVAIRERGATTNLWEGRADYTVKASSPLAQTALGAPKLAAALFGGFPGNSGETIAVR